MVPLIYDRDDMTVYRAWIHHDPLPGWIHQDSLPALIHQDPLPAWIYQDPLHERSTIIQVSVHQLKYGAQCVRVAGAARPDLSCHFCAESV